MRGRQTVAKALVAIAVEAPEDGSGIGRIRMRVVADASAASLLGFVRKAVEPGCHRAYRRLAGLRPTGGNSGMRTR